MQTNDAIEILQVANGFLVRLPRDVLSSDRAAYMSINDSMVFQSFAATAQWLSFHFTHRDDAVTHDGIVKPTSGA